MMDLDLKEYAADFKLANKQPKEITTEKTYQVSTGINTVRRRARGGISWIEYYRAFTDPNQTQFICASCGKPISADKDMNDDVNKAEGGHILFIGKDSSDHVDLNYYIVPLCHECHHTSKSYLNISKDVTAIEEVNAEVCAATVE